MAISVFDLFKIGIGPSSSHVIGPMKAMRLFIDGLKQQGLFDKTARVNVDLYGSLAHTGKGHGTDRAVIMGLCGEAPETLDPASVAERVAACEQTAKLRLDGDRLIAFQPREQIRFHYEELLELHSNGLVASAFDAHGMQILRKTYYSVGGGFVLNQDEVQGPSLVPDTTRLNYPFTSAEELLAHCAETGKSIATIMMANEQSWRDCDEIRQGLLEIWRVMEACIARGLETEGTLPGHLKVRRRAPALRRKLEHQRPRSTKRSDIAELDWVNLYAIAVNEENAAGGRVVTAPTNGAAGIIPAVLKYYMEFYQGKEESVVCYLLTAGAIGILYKENASISGAEVGCQGEVGSACSMAAGALCALMGGTPEQIENAAEVAMEHNLGLTCDPVGGLVQIPCIERNAMAAIKAINAARMAMLGDGKHYVSLDKVIKTMRETGMDMMDKYKETARGGLAVNIVEC